MSIPTSFDQLGTLGAGEPLPQGYTRVLCIITDYQNHQIIDTNVIPDNGTKWELDVAYLRASSYNGLYNGNPPRFHMSFDSDMNAAIGIGSYSASYFSVAAEYGQRLLMSIDMPNHIVKIGDAAQTFDHFEACYTGPVYLGARSQSNTYLFPGNEKIYRSRIWENSALVQDLVPVLDARGIPCMYDLSGTGDAEARTHRNIGEGAFGHETL